MLLELLRENNQNISKKPKLQHFKNYSWIPLQPPVNSFLKQQINVRAYLVIYALPEMVTIIVITDYCHKQTNVIHTTDRLTGLCLDDNWTLCVKSVKNHPSKRDIFV